jgi:hypothetical protein
MQTPSSTYENKNLQNGAPNPKYVDLLEEDKPIAGQKFVCISFVSPEKVLKDKQLYFFQMFLKKYDFQKSMEKFLQFLNFLSFKYKISFDELSRDYQDYIKEEHEALAAITIEDEYKTFLDREEEDLENAFNTQHHFNTSVRGLKVRGVFPTMEEAELRCKLLRELDPNHDVFVGPVGLWMPWDPEPYKTGRVEYMEDELNQLMHEKTKNETFAKNAFEARVKETKRKAIEENIKKAELTGAVLTQNIDEEGNLIGVHNTQQTRLLDDRENGSGGDEGISVTDIQRELFEGDNIVVGKTDYGQSELISGPFANKKNTD